MPLGRRTLSRTRTPSHFSTPDHGPSSESSNPWRKVSVAGSYTPKPAANSQYAQGMPRASAAKRPLDIPLAFRRIRKAVEPFATAAMFELAADGFDIQMHTHRHRTPARMDLFEKELRDNRVRIEELTGRDLGSARDRIEFWLALRGRELVTN